MSSTARYATPVASSIGGPQTGRPLPSTPIDAQRPGAVGNGHSRQPSIPSFLQRFLPPQHPLSHHPHPPNDRNPEDYAFTPTVSNDLSRNLWTSLVSNLSDQLPSGTTIGSLLFPSPDQDQPEGLGAPHSAPQVLALLERHHWKLEEAQKDILARHALAAAKANGNNPSDVLLGAEYSANRRGTPCGHIFRKGEAIYRCRYVYLSSFCSLLHLLFFAVATLC